MNTDTTQNPHPFGYWITAVDRLMAAEFATAFEGEGADRRDWRLLNVVDGTAAAHRPLRPHTLRGLVERGWVTREGDGWSLTDDGRAAKERLGALVDNIRAQVTDAVSPDDLETTIATLQQIARAFGWDEATPLPRRRTHGRHRGSDRHGFSRHGARNHGSDRGHGHGHGFPRERGHGHGHGFGHDHEHRFHGHGRDSRPGFEHGHGHSPDRAHGFDHGHRDPRAAHHEGHCDHRHQADEAHRTPRGHGRDGHRHGHHRHGGHRIAQRAYERGFDAGYSRGSAA
ncbi:MarR family winged helix-turn-helix transcriptional regulator [Streptomyces sp. AC495_CC817]|uniref:MarR family winged helix-turn-helix transcriptional regulator n=1 Tax=Streptomyces sp. AC495_CC817 TaxID=2823900 RepID=UPI001C270D17|nr:hypothetical protein [Streptomyces sp. AC495_CC817]